MANDNLDVSPMPSWPRHSVRGREASPTQLRSHTSCEGLVGIGLGTGSESPLSWTLVLPNRPSLQLFEANA